MKITQTREDVEAKNRLIAQANKGCNVCPCCGESKNMWDYLREGESSKGIENGIYRTKTKGLFRMKTYKIDCYSCLICGAAWESEPYEY